MKGKYTEPTIGAIICWYIRVKGQKLCQDVPQIPMEFSSATKSQDRIGWDNMMWGRIARHWNQWKSEYFKIGKSRNTGLNWARYFIQKYYYITWLVYV